MTGHAHFTGLHGAPGQHKPQGIAGKADKRPHCYRCGEVTTAEQLAKHSEKLCDVCLTAKRAMDKRVYGVEPKHDPLAHVLKRDVTDQLRSRSRYPRQDTELSRGFRPTFR